MRILDRMKTRLKLAILHVIHLLDRVQCKALPSPNHSLPFSHWDIAINSQNHLAIQECDVVTLARRHGTPLYVIDKKSLEKNYHQFHGSFSSRYPRVEIAYSYKTNPLPRVISVLHQVGASAEVISEFELWLALKLGVPPERIIYNGPAKTRSGLELAVSQNIKLINIDNVAEIDSIEAFAKQRGVRQAVGVRVVTSVGWSSQFGVSLLSDQAFEAFNRLKKMEHMVASGLHIHLGTGIQDVGIYLQAIREVLEFARVLQHELDVSIEHFDFGGGFGIPTVRPYSGIDFKLMQNNLPPRMAKFRHQVGLEEYANAITDLMAEYYPLNGYHIPAIIFEPGRAITSSAQVLLLEVIAVKKAMNGVTTVILNGGKNLTMPMGYEYHEMFVASRMTGGDEGYHNLFGPLCHPGDILFKCKRLPRVAVGDIIAVMDAGAYFVPNQMNFSNPRPGAVMVESGKAEVVREPEVFEDMIALDLV